MRFIPRLGALVFSASLLFSLAGPSAKAGDLYKGTIKGDAVIGCDRESFDRSINFAVSGDNAAYARLMSRGLATGTCIKFRNGQTVFIEDRTFTGARCIRPEGSAEKCVWIVREEMEQ
jgi:hypothetical protein